MPHLFYLPILEVAMSDQIYNTVTLSKLGDFSLSINVKGSP